MFIVKGMAIVGDRVVTVRSFKRKDGDVFEPGLSGLVTGVEAGDEGAPTKYKVQFGEPGAGAFVVKFGADYFKLEAGRVPRPRPSSPRARTLSGVIDKAVIQTDKPWLNEKVPAP